MIIYPGRSHRYKSEIKPVLDEITKASREMLRLKGSNPSENTNKVISNKGMDYLRTHVEQDTHYSSVLDTRICSLLGHGWKIVPASRRENGRIVIDPLDREICDFVNYALTSMDSDIESDIVAMMSHISRGFSLSEKNYRYIEVGTFKGKLGLKNIRFKEQDIFAFEFDELGYYKLNQTDPEKKPLEIKKFIHFINGINDENPYGYSVGAICAFYVWLKENGAKFWAVFEERFGTPFVVLEVPDSIKDDAKMQAAADEVLEAVQNDTGMQVPKGMVLKFLEATRSGEANYRGFVEFCNNEMSKAILGSTLAVDTQKNASGSHALGQEHAAVMGLKFNYDIISSMAAINQQLIKQLVDFNYLNVERYPRFVWQQVDFSWFITFAQGVEALLRSGMTIPMSWIYELGNIPLPELDEDVLVYMPGQSLGIVPTPAGVDNKTPNKAQQIEKDATATFGQDRNPTLQYSAEETAARELIAGNERIVNDGKTFMTGLWSKLIAKVAEMPYFDAQFVADFAQKELVGAYSQVLIIGALRGVESGLYETQPVADNNYHTERHGKTRKDQTGVSGVRISAAKFNEFYYKPFDKIIEDYRKRGILSKAEFDKLSEEMKRRAFTVANLDSTHVIQKVKDELNEILRNKGTIVDFYDQVIDVFVRAGVSGAASRIETVMRTNLQTTYMDGRERVFAQTNQEDFPYKQVLAVMDSATRDRHRSIHQYTRPVNDPVWSWLKPPLEFNCRCTVRLVHQSEQVTESDWVPDRGDYEFTR